MRSYKLHNEVKVALHFELLLHRVVLLIQCDSTKHLAMEYSVRQCHYFSFELCSYHIKTC